MVESPPPSAWGWVCPSQQEVGIDASGTAGPGWGVPAGMAWPQEGEAGWAAPQKELDGESGLC